MVRLRNKLEPKVPAERVDQSTRINRLARVPPGKSYTSKCTYIHTHIPLPNSASLYSSQGAHDSDKTNAYLYRPIQRKCIARPRRNDQVVTPGVMDSLVPYILSSPRFLVSRFLLVGFPNVIMIDWFPSRGYYTYLHIVSLFLTCAHSRLEVTPGAFKRVKFQLSIPFVRPSAASHVH